MIKTLDPSITKLRLAVCTGDPANPLSLSRACGPLYDMAAEDRRLEIALPLCGKDWPFIADCDALFIEQAYTVEDIQTALQARRMGKPVWLDYGDDLFNVEKTNTAFAHFANVKELRKNIADLIGLADVVSTATATLRDVYQKLVKPAVPGSGPQFVVLPESARFGPSALLRKKIITWRGLDSHLDDLGSVLPVLKDVLRSNPDWSLLMFGSEHIKAHAFDYLTEGDDEQHPRVNVTLAPWFNNPWGMINAWKGAAPYLHIYPLPDTAFNRSKPPAVWLEATAVGAAVIGPDLPEWRVPGMIHYRNSALTLLPAAVNSLGLPEDFETVLRREMGRFSQGALHPHVFPARQAVYPHLTVPAVNQVRWQILRCLRTATGKPAEAAEVMP